MLTDPQRIHDTLDPYILPYVEMPARYVGGELNSVRKDPDTVDVRLALCFPDLYEIGMSHLGYQILYHLVNELDWAAAERAYAVWPDMQAAMREHDVPLYTLESFGPVAGFDVVGFSLQYEMLCTNVLAMLDLAGLPVASADRTGEHPLVIAGGPGCANPEPMADFIDVFLLGEGEESLVPMLELVRRARAEGWDRPRLLRETASGVPGAYVPALYDVSYRDDGTVDAVRPSDDAAPERVRAAKVTDMAGLTFPTDPIVPLMQPVHDRVALEIMRGCTRGCRFCQAGMLRRPVRPRPVAELVRLAEDSLASTGHGEVALTSLSSSDHPEFRELLKALCAVTTPSGVNLSLSSLRVNDQLEMLPELVSAVRKSGLTVAPEAGTDRLRRVINKKVTNEELLAGARAAFAEGWKQIKLYFMIGLPTETEEDQEAIVQLCQDVSGVGREVSRGPGKVSASVAVFVPKPHTPFQWEPMALRESVAEARARILKSTRMRSVKYSFHDDKTSRLEGVLSRGDRRVGRVIRRVWETGGQFDAWREHFDYERWMQAFEDEGLDPAFYAHRQRAEDEVLPWDHLDFGVSKEFLLREREKARREEFTEDCRWSPCPWCGACSEAGSQKPAAVRAE